MIGCGTRGNVKNPFNDLVLPRMGSLLRVIVDDHRIFPLLLTSFLLLPSPQTGGEYESHDGSHQVGCVGRIQYSLFPNASLIRAAECILLFAWYGNKQKRSRVSFQ